MGCGGEEEREWRLTWKYEGLASVNESRLVMCASWQSLMGGFVLPQRLGDRSLTHSDDFISKEWLSDPWERPSGDICIWEIHVYASQRDWKNLKPFWVNALRKASLGPIFRCWLEGTVNPFDTLSFSRREHKRGCLIPVTRLRLVEDMLNFDQVSYCRSWRAVFMLRVFAVLNFAVAFCFLPIFFFFLFVLWCFPYSAFCWLQLCDVNWCVVLSLVFPVNYSYI